MCGNAALPEAVGVEDPNSGSVFRPTTPVTSSRSAAGIRTVETGAMKVAPRAAAPAVRKLPRVVPNSRPACDTFSVASANRPVTSILTAVAPACLR